MATFDDLKDFVEADGWTEERNLVRGRRRTGDHLRHSKRLPDGRLLRTKVSHSRDEIGPDLFRHILRDQLSVSEKEFWAAVKRRRDPVVPSSERPAPMPGRLVLRLIHTVGLSEAEVSGMSREHAEAAWNEYLSRERTRAADESGASLR